MCGKNLEPLEVSVYKSGTRADTYVFLPSDETLESLPDAVQNQFVNAEPFLTFELTADRHLAQAEPEKVLSSIANLGFYLQLPPQPDAREAE